MKVLTYYQCSFCDTVYKTEQEAAVCEDNHKHTPEIVEKEYRSITEDKKGYPVRILLHFDNDEPQNFVEYECCKVITKDIPTPDPEPSPEPDPNPDEEEPTHSDDDVVIEEEEDGE